MEEILFAQGEVSRQDRKVKHSVREILTVVLCGAISGERSGISKNLIRFLEISDDF